MEALDKQHVLLALRRRLAEKQAAVADSQQSTQQGATHSEARPEHAKDTRATEASYLARGLAQRVEELARDASLLDTLELRPFGDDDAIAVGALVCLESGGGDRSLSFVTPAGGGERLEVDGTAVRAVTPASPLGRALMGRRVDDEVAVRLPSGSQLYTVAWLR